jgi:lipopolysaccharide transport system permease protein
VSDAGSVAGPPSLIVIEPTSGRLPSRLDELWSYRELFGFLVWRDIKVRYAQTVLGGIWMVFQPLAMMLVYTFAFAYLLRSKIPGVPYTLYALSGLTLWIFVSRALFTGSESLITNLSLVTKTSCPRLLIPLAAVVSVFVDFLVALGLFLVLAAVYGRYPTWRFVFVPLILLGAFVLVLGLSFMLSVTNVRYRDVGQALPFLIQLWFFLTPVAYVLQTPGESWQTLVQALNPLVGLMLALRWAMLGMPPPHGILLAAVLVSLVLLVLGFLRFGKAERTLADDV